MVIIYKNRRYISGMIFQTRSRIKLSKYKRKAGISRSGPDKLLFTPYLITLLIRYEDASFGLSESRPSPKAILNGEIRYCLQVTCEQ